MTKDPGEALCARLIARYDPSGRVLKCCSTGWASATFTGARHCFQFAMSPEGARRLAALAANDEFDIPDHLVADLAVIEARRASDGGGDEVEVTVEALTVEAA